MASSFAEKYVKDLQLTKKELQEAVLTDPPANAEIDTERRLHDEKITQKFLKISWERMHRKGSPEDYAGPQFPGLANNHLTTERKGM